MSAVDAVLIITFITMMVVGGMVGSSSSIKSNKVKNAGNICLVIGGLGAAITMFYGIFSAINGEGPQLGKDLHAHGFTVAPRTNEGLGEAFVVDPARGNCRITFVNSRQLGTTLVFESAAGPAISEPGELHKIPCDKP